MFKYLFFSVAITITFQACKSSQENEVPNIVYILADDLGYGDVSIYNPESKIQTPNIDRLASQGIRFMDAHTPSSVCTPTRYAILTGQYCWRSRLPKGVLRGYGRSLLKQGQTTVASLLQDHNYHTGVVGKWHLGLDWVIKPAYLDSLSIIDPSNTNEVGMVQNMPSSWIDFSKSPTDGPNNHGFAYSFVLPASLDMEPYCYLENGSLISPLDSTTPGNDMNTGYTGAFWRPGLMASEFDFQKVMSTFTRKAIAFLEERRSESVPFFLYLPYASPHTPWMPGEAFNGSSGAGQYGDFVQMVDDEVGKILLALKEMDLEQNTLVIFTSDNGPFWQPRHIEEFDHRAASIYRGMKADIYEGGHRVPFIVRWPGEVAPGILDSHTITHTNLLATCADILDISLSKTEDSYSILPYLLGKQDVPSPSPVIHHSSRGHFAIRDGKWKLIEILGSGGFTQPALEIPQIGDPPGQLYDLEADPGETQNLYDVYPAIVTQLTEKLDSIRAQ